MDKIAVLIIEDTPEESDALIEILTAHQFEIAGVARTHQDALKLFYSQRVDILIIDVFLHGAPDGIMFAETITTIPDAAKPFVFLTSSTDRQIFERAKLTRPYSFLLKPFNPLEVIYALEMALEKFYDQHEPDEEDEKTIVGKDSLFIRKNDSLKKVALQSILYIEVEERYCTIYTETEKFVIMISLKRITEQLDPKRFCRTHRKYIVNIDKIVEIQPGDNLIILEGRHLVPMSDTYRDFMTRFRTLK